MVRQHSCTNSCFAAFAWSLHVHQNVIPGHCLSGSLKAQHRCTYFMIHDGMLPPSLALAIAGRHRTLRLGLGFLLGAKPLQVAVLVFHSAQCNYTTPLGLACRTVPFFWGYSLPPGMQRSMAPGIGVVVFGGRRPRKVGVRGSVTIRVGGGDPGAMCVFLCFRLDCLSQTSARSTSATWFATPASSPT